MAKKIANKVKDEDVKAEDIIEDVKTPTKKSKAIIYSVSSGNIFRVYSLLQADPGTTNHIEKAKGFLEKNKGKFKMQIVEE